MAKTKVLICPYCGETQPAGEHCKACGGLFEPLSRQATHNAMGPWFIRDADRPFQPGCSYDTLTRLIERGVVTKLTIVRGPTTKQFWTVAKRVGGISHLLGYCHQCDSDVKPTDHGCPVCGAAFGGFMDRNYLGLPELRPMPWEESVSDYAGSPPAGPPPRVNAPSGVSAFQSAGPGRISSFATNEELVDTGPAKLPAPTPVRSAAPQVSKVENVSDVEEAASAPSELSDARELQPSAAPTMNVPIAPMSYDDSALRLARRRALQYQKTAQRLWIALALCVVVIVALATVIVTRNNNVVEESEPMNNSIQSGQAKPQQPAATTKSAANQTPPSDNKTIPPKPVATAGDDVADGDGGAAASIDPSTRPVDERDQKYEKMIADAAALTKSAQDESREQAQRIADYVQLVELLNDIRVNAPASVRPADIAEQIESAERELERLRLREFFP